MSFYLTITCILMILAFYTRNNPRTSHITFNVAIIIVFFIAAFRYDVGCDWGAYALHYEFHAQQSIFELKATEPAYWALLTLIKNAGLPFETLMLATSSIFFSGFYFLLRTQPNPMTILAISFPVLIFALPMSAIRQAAAMGFLMAGFVYLLRGKVLIYCAFVVAGFLFHTSAIIFLLIAPAVRYGVSFRNLMFFSPILLFVTYRISLLEGVGVGADRYLVLTDGNNAFGAPFRTILLSLSGLFFLVFLRKKWRRENPSDYGLILIGASLLLVTFPLSFIIPTISDRFGFYFIIFQAMIFARLHHLQTKNSDFWLLIFFFGTVGFFALWFTLSWQLPRCYTPYDNVILRFIGQ